jgi:hypothetical protein
VVGSRAVRLNPLRSLQSSCRPSRSILPWIGATQALLKPDSTVRSPTLAIPNCALSGTQDPPLYRGLYRKDLVALVNSSMGPIGWLLLVAP